MKLAFHLHAVRGHFRARLPTRGEQAWIFDRIARQGFHGIDVSDSWGFSSVTRDVASVTQGLAAERGLAIATVSCMGKTLCHPEMGAANLAAVTHALEVTGWLDCETVNIALATPRQPGVVPVMGAAASPGGSRLASDQDFAITIDRLRLVARLAAPRGITLSIELHDRSLADTARNLLAIVDAVNEPNVGANPDLCNGYRAYDVPPETWQEALFALAPRANLWHVNNMQRVHFAEIGRAAFVERPLSEGDVDYRLAYRMMRAAGFDGWVVVEYKGTGDAFACTEAGKRYLDDIIASEVACDQQTAE